jgi:hypothetical protein
VIGLTFTNAWSQPGIVVGTTNTLLMKVSGNSTIMLVPITEFGVRRISPRVVKIHPSPDANTSSSRIAASTPGTPPAGRNPSTSPSASTTTDPIV